MSASGQRRGRSVALRLAVVVIALGFEEPRGAPNTYGGASAALPRQATDDAYSRHPEPDHKALFKLYMAANGDALLKSPLVVWEYFTLFHAPPRTASGTTTRPVPLSPECFALYKSVQNEITARKMLDQARTDFAAALQEAASWPKKLTMRLTATVSLGRYDANGSKFPLTGVQGNWFGQAGGATYVPAGSKIGSSVYYQGAEGPWCRVKLPRGVASEGGAAFDLPRTLQVDVAETGVLHELPMESAAAEALLESLKGGGTMARRIRVEALVEVGPARLATTLQQAVNVPARILAARAVHPESGKVLHEFTPPKSAAASSTLPRLVRATYPAAAGARRISGPGTPQGSEAVYTQAEEPDHLALFKLLMAANGDALATNDQAVWEYLTLFQAPAPRSPECTALGDAMRNEITAARRLADGRKQFAENLKAAEAWPKTRVFRLSHPASLEEYDAAKNVFRLSPLSPIVAPGGFVRLAWGPSLHDTYQGPVVEKCRMSSAAGLRLEKTMPATFRLKFAGNEPLRELPMAPGSAEAYLDSRTGREAGSRRVRIEALVEVGPALLPTGATNLRLVDVTAAIVAARAVDPESGRVLHEWRVPQLMPKAYALVRRLERRINPD